MKNAAEYSRRVKRLYTKIKKDGSKTSLATVDDSMRALLLGVFSNYTTEQRAASTMDKLIGSMVDLNELRVTPVSEIIENVGVDFPHCRAAAEEISQALNALFNTIHELDLSFLKSLGKKSSTSFLDSLDGLRPHTKAFFKQRYLNIHAVPLDANMHSFLERNECIAGGTDVEQAQRFIAGVIKDRDGAKFYSLLKRYAAAHAPRKPSKKTHAAKPKTKTAKKTQRVTKKTTTRKAASKSGTLRSGATSSTARKKTTSRKSTKKKVSAARKKAR
ncbi:MAG: hypothetical protein ACE5EQ_03090 [Phycisphaerae bacterium]